MEFKQYVKDINTNVFLNAAYSLSLEVQFINKEFNLVKISHNNKSLKVFKNITSLNSKVNSDIAINKFLSSLLLSQNGIQVPKVIRYKFSDYKDFNKLVEKVMSDSKEFSKSVIKPNTDSLALGVFIGPVTIQDFSQAILNINKGKNKHFLQEQYISGKEYRVLVLNGEVIDILERIPANIIGNGINTIRELIDEKNLIRKNKNVPTIEIDETLLRVLRQSKLILEDIIEKDKQIKLKDVCNFGQGGDVKRINLDSVDLNYLEMFKKVQAVSGLNFVGIDLICTDISQYDDNRYVNEINSDPMIELHYFADLAEGKSGFSTAEKIFLKFFN